MPAAARTTLLVPAALLTAYVLKALVKHANAGDVTATNYVRADDAILQAGWQTVADFIEAKASEPPGAEVADPDAERETKSKAAA